MLGALRVAGVEPTARGLRIEPHVPERKLGLVTRVLELTQDGGILEGKYAPVPGRPRVLTFVAKEGEVFVEASVDGVAIPVPPSTATLDVPITASGPGGVRFRLVAGPRRP